jgi:hypothetical protein
LTQGAVGHLNRFGGLREFEFLKNVGALRLQQRIEDLAGISHIISKKVR